MRALPWLSFTALLATLVSAGNADAVLAPAGAEFQVNTYTSSAQYDPDVAPLSAGNFVVVWTSYLQDDSYGGVFGQRMAVDGMRVGTEFQVNTFTVGYQQSPAVAGTPSGNFMVVWEDDYQAINCPDRIMGRLYDATGAPITGELQINASAFPCGVSDADVAAIGDDDFMVVWQSLQAGVDQSEIAAQRISEIGAKVGTEFQINTYTTQHQDYPAIASRSDGSFVVVWGGRSSSTNADIRGQRFDADATALGTEFRINTYTTGQQLEPDVAAADAGDFVAVWRSIDQDGSYSGVYGQRFDAAGVPAGTEFLVNVHTTDSQGNAGIDVAYAPSGDFVVTWNSFYQDGSYSGVLVRGFAADGAAVSGELFANSYTPNSQRRSSIAADANGDFVVAWDSYTQDDDYHAVIGRRFMLDADATTTTVAPMTTTTAPTTTTTIATTTTTTATTSTTSTTLPDDGLCGDANADTAITATDALVGLRTAVGTSQCDLCVCDVDSSGLITASDALAILRNAVGQPVALVCVACGGAVIGPDGGIVSSLDGGLDLFVPAGALAANTRISIVIADETGLPGAESRTAPVYRIEPDGTEFARPATVSVVIDPTTEADSVISVVTYDESEQMWTALDATTIIAGNALAPSQHLSLFSAATQPSGSGCDNIWSGGPGTVPPLHAVGAITVVPGTKTGETIAFSGPSEISLGSTWDIPACSAQVDGAFGQNLAGSGGWIDYSNGGTGTIGGTGGTFSVTFTHDPPANPRGPYLGLGDPCHAPLGVYHYNLNLNFAGDCPGLCNGVNCDDGNPCTFDTCNPSDGNCEHTAAAGTCGSTGGGLCVQGLCMVEVQMNAGASGNSVCAAEGFTCDTIPVLSPREEACIAFNPTASMTSSVNGWRQAVYCNDNEGLACSGKTDTCHHCPLCSTTGLTCETSASDQLERLYASCVP